MPHLTEVRLIQQRHNSVKDLANLVHFAAIKISIRAVFRLQLGGFFLGGQHFTDGRLGHLKAFIGQHDVLSVIQQHALAGLSKRINVICGFMQNVYSFRAAGRPQPA